MNFKVGNEYVNSAYIGYFVYLGELWYPDFDFGGTSRIPAFLHYPQDSEFEPCVIRWSDLYERESHGFRPRIKVSGI